MQVDKKNPVVEFGDLNNAYIDEENVCRSFNITVWHATKDHQLFQMTFNPPTQRDSRVGRELHEYLTQTALSQVISILLTVGEDEKSREHCCQSLVKLAGEKFDMKSIGFSLARESRAYVEDIDWLYMAKRQSRYFHFTEVSEKGETVIRFVNAYRDEVVATIPKPASA